MHIIFGSRAASFTRPLLSKDVSVCVCACVGNFDVKFSETKRFRGFVYK